MTPRPPLSHRLVSAPAATIHLAVVTSLALGTSGCIQQASDPGTDGGRIDGGRIDGGRTEADAGGPRPATCCVWDGPKPTEGSNVYMNETGDLLRSFDTGGAPASSFRVRIRRCDGETHELTVNVPAGYTASGATWAGRDHLWVQLNDDAGPAARGVFDLAGNLMHVFEIGVVCQSGESVFTLGRETADWELRRFDLRGTELDRTTGAFGETAGGVPALSPEFEGGCARAATRDAGDGFVLVSDEEGAEWRWDGAWTRLSEPCTWPGAAAGCLDESTDLVSTPNSSVGSVLILDGAGEIGFLRSGILASDHRTFMFELRNAAGVVQWTNTDLRWGSQSGLPFGDLDEGRVQFTYAPWLASDGDVGLRLQIQATACNRQRVGLAGHPLSEIVQALIRFDRSTGAIVHIETFAVPTEPISGSCGIRGIGSGSVALRGGDECNGVVYELGDVLHRLDENGDPAPRRDGTP